MLDRVISAVYDDASDGKFPRAAQQGRDGGFQFSDRVVKNARSFYEQPQHMSGGFVSIGSHAVHNGGAGDRN
jgi:hypothetical protein